TWDYFEFSHIDTIRDMKTCYPVYTVAASPEYVWFAASASGVHQLHKVSGSMTTFDGTNSAIAGDWVWTIAVDGNYVWIGTYGHGVSRYQIPSSLWTCYRKADGLIDESVEDIELFEDEAWFGTHRGLSRLNVSTGAFQNYDVLNSDIGTMLIYAVGVDSQSVWLGPRLIHYNKETDVWTKIDTTATIFARKNIYSIEMEEDDVWFGANDGVIARYRKSPDEWIVYDSANTGCLAIVYDLDVDVNGLWFASFGDGAGHFDFQSNIWAKYDTTNSGLTHDNVTSVGIDGSYIWFGTLGGGISRFNISTNEWVTFDAASTGNSPYFDYIWSLAIDGDYIWAGSHSYGVYRYEKSTGEWENFNHLNSPLPERRVYDIAADRRHVWISVFATDNSPIPQRTGGVCRYGDVYPPVISHAPIYEEQPSAQPVLIISSINDNLTVKSATVNYRLSGDPNFRQAILSRRSGDTWIGQIPSVDVTPGVMEYYLSATDGRNNATHPYSSAINSPHRFPVYDSVPPRISASISSSQKYIASNTVINASVSIDGTGSTPSLQNIMLVQYSDLAAETALDSSEIEFSISWEEKSENSYSFTGSFNSGILPQMTRAVKLKITASDSGHDADGHPFETTVFSNPLFKYTGGGSSMAQISAPDSMAVVTGLVTISGTAYDENFKQYTVSYLDSLNQSNVIQSSFETRQDAMLASWNTDGLAEGTYQILLEVENMDAAISTAIVPVVLDTTHPRCEITNLSDNMITGGQVAVIGSAADRHFKEYYLEYGAGINPAKWNAVGGIFRHPVENDTLGTWNTLGMNGYHTLRLRVIDAAGLSSSITKTIIIDNTHTNAVISAPVDQQLVTQQVEIRGTVADANFKSYAVEYASAQNYDDWITIFRDTSVVNTGLLATWDTGDLNGSYCIRLTASDKNDFRKKDSVTVIVDNLPPVAEINSPKDSSQVGGIVPVYGSGADDNFAEYILEWGQGDDPSIWTKITGTRYLSPVHSGLLAEWNTEGKIGSYSLRLTSIDKLGYIAQDQIGVDIIGEIDSKLGGCVHSPDGVIKFCFPQNAISGNQFITINIDADAPVQNEDLLCPVYKIAPAGLKLSRHGVLHVKYNDTVLSKMTDQRKLAIVTHTEADSSWEILGGTMDTQEQSITTAVRNAGWYSLIEDKATGGDQELLDLSIEPRIFSPRGSGHNNEAHISFSLASDSQVTINIFNLAGRLVKKVCTNRYMSRGTNSIAWDGRDNAGNFNVSGLYIVTIHSGKKTATKTVMVLNN
ncbi:T9SS type A sorting domain-containing protein, partial [candidate division KSB1 bacterium]|nr:T9SS type A sorting domain-containing protein [candidate division KSB1 bacterium]